jgi:hypothetical protein
LAVGLHAQNVAIIEPAVKLPKTIGSGLYFEARVTAHERHDNVTGKAAADSAAQRNANSGKAFSLQYANDAALGATAFVS